MRDVFAIELPLREIFEQPALAALARSIERLREEGSAAALPPLVRVPRDRDLPLSFQQLRLWFLDQFEPGQSVYNIPIGLRLAGRFDLAVMERSIGEVVRRHEVLRTTFAVVGGQPVQRIAPPGNFRIELSDLSGLPRDERERRLRREAAREAGRPFDLAAGPLFRVILWRLAEDDHGVLILAHHTVSDGWSTELILREVTALYEAFAGGRPSPLPEPALQYADYAVWQREQLAGEIEEQVEWWKRQLAAWPTLEMPTDRPRPPVPSHRGAATPPYRLDAAFTDRLRALGRPQRSTLFMTLLAAFHGLLARSSGQNDVVVGTPIAGRSRREVEPLIGYFVNTLILRSRYEGDPRFDEMIAIAREASLGASSHHDVPFERLVEILQPDRDMSRNPLFQVMFVLQDEVTKSVELAGLSATPLNAHTGTAKFDFTIAVAESARGLDVSFELATDLFDRTTLMRLGERWRTMLEAVVENPGLRLSAIPVVGAAERHQILGEWNDTAFAPGVAPRQELLHELFEARVDEDPARVAAVCGGLSLTYGEVEEWANRIARQLRAAGIGPGDMVALYLSRGLEMVPALLGVLKSGAGYLPLETAFPRERVRWMLGALGVRAALTQTRHAADLREIAAELPLLAHGICLDDEPADEPDDAIVPGALRFYGPDDLAALPAGRPARLGSPDDVAYVIFTSGSTGQSEGSGAAPPAGDQPDRLGQCDLSCRPRGSRAVHHLALLRPLGLRHLRPARGGRLDPRGDRGGDPRSGADDRDPLRRAGHVLGFGAGGAAPAGGLLP